MNIFNALFSNFTNSKTFKKKTRSEIVSKKSEQILNEILIEGFSNKEVGQIVTGLKTLSKDALLSRKTNLEKELFETVEGINSL